MARRDQSKGIQVKIRSVYFSVLCSLCSFVAKDNSGLELLWDFPPSAEVSHCTGRQFNNTSDAAIALQQVAPTFAGILRR
jgi:hypothetical protein